MSVITRTEERILVSPVVNRPRNAPVYTAAAILGLAVAFFVLKLWHADFTIPWYYARGGDVFGLAAGVKNLSEGYSVFSFPHLAAPLGGLLYDIPSLSTLHVFIWRILALITGNPYVAINLAYLAAFPLTAVTSLFAMRRLNVPSAIALPLSVLYTALPARFDRNQAHLVYATYWLLPLVVLACVLLARGDAPFFSRGRRLWHPTRFGWNVLLLGVLLGADNQYHAFFAGAFFVVAAALGALRARRIDPLIGTCTFFAAIALTVVVQLLPAAFYHARHGPNTVAFERHPEESIIYGLNIAQLVLPISDHRAGKLAAKRAYYDTRTGLAGNESGWASLGLAGTIGFFVLLGALVVRSGRSIPRDIDTLSMLNIGAILLATVGGFGTLFNFYVRPEIRAYNRISTLIGFVCLAGLALVLTEVARRQRWKMPLPAVVASIIVVIVVGTWDQTSPAMIPPWAQDTALFQSDQTFMAAVESKLTPNAAVFELPWVPFPESPPIAQLDPESLFRPYLHATNLRFSYGALAGRDPEAWQADVVHQPARDMTRSMILAGFDGLIVFRLGYADNGAAIEGTLAPMLGQPLVSPDGTLAFYSMRTLRKRAIAALPIIGTSAFQDRYVRVVHALYGAGFSFLEQNASETWRWSDGNSQISLINGSATSRTVRFRGIAQIPTRADILTISLPTKTVNISSGPKGAPFDITMIVPPGRSTITFKTAAPLLVAPGDTRALAFRIANPTIETVDTTLRPSIERAFDGGALAAPSATSGVPAIAPSSRPESATTSVADTFADARLTFVNGCTPLESNGSRRWHWCSESAHLTVSSLHAANLGLHFVVSTPGQPVSRVRVVVAGKATTLATSTKGTVVNLPIHTAGSKAVPFSISSDAAPLVAPGDPRRLVIRLDDVTVSAR